MNKKIKSILVLLVSVLLWHLLTAVSAIAGQFSINPMIVELGSKDKSGVITIRNQEKDSQINFQVSPFEWTQDAKGDDIYTQTKDLVVFPRILTIDAAEERIIRIGMKGPHTANEKTYRIFIEEIPSPLQQKNRQSTNIGIYLRITPPVFIKPLTEKASGAIEDMSLKNGKIQVSIRNTGNVYFRIYTVTFKGKTSKDEVLYKQEIPGWYLLYGKSRIYGTSIPLDICKRLSVIEVDARTTKIDLNRVLNVSREMCEP